MKDHLTRWIRAATLVLGLTACGVQGGPFEPAEGAAPVFARGSANRITGAATGTIQSLDETVTGILEAGLQAAPELLSCLTEPSQTTVATIGTRGGTISAGRHTLFIPRGALSGNVSITLEVVSDTVNSVRFSPHGLSFAKPATLTMSYANCSGGTQAPKLIVYTDELLNILEAKPSVDDGSGSVSTELDHFSRYAVAW